MSSSSLETFSPEAVRAQLDRILSSRLFARSLRLRRFLSFTVDYVLEGKTDEVKEYLIGTAVFDRKADYDPRVDPIVRVEARRLRNKLKAYYAHEGSADEIRIDFPTGAYVPVIRARAAADIAPVDAPSPETPSCIGIAVLPFANLTPEQAGDYFCDGLAEEILHLLTCVSGLRLVAWHSASQLRGRDQDYRAIVHQLQVRRVLRGSVRLSGDRVRVTAQLVDTAAGSYLWSEVYDRALADVFAIQEEIARAIVDALRLKLARRETAVRLPVNSEAHRLCLLGRFHINKRTVESIRRAAECFEQALLIDPDSALAHAHMADAYTLLADYAAVPPVEIAPRAEAAAQRALELDPNLAEAHASLALIRALYDRRWQESEALFRRAIQLNPNYAPARHWLACDVLALLGRNEEGFEQARRAIDLDPLSMIIREAAGYFQLLARDYPAALKWQQEIIDLAPDSHRGYSAVGRVLGLMGRYDESLQAFRTARRIAPNIASTVAAMGQVLAEAGRPNEARECLQQLTTMERSRYVPGTCFAVVHVGLGEVDAALQRLERACENREFSVTALKVHPAFDPIRRHPRALRLIERLGL